MTIDMHTVVRQTMTKTNFTSIMMFDPIGHAYRKLLQIPKPYYKSFLITLSINVIVFLYLLTNFPEGNHDWPVLLYVPMHYEVTVGRWFYFFVNAFFGFMRLPVIIQLTAIVAHIIASQIAFSLLSRTVKVANITFFSLMVTLTPYILTTYYYSVEPTMFAIASLFATMSIYFSAKANISIKHFILCAIFTCLTPATYQPQLNTVATLFCLYILCDLTEAINRDDYRLLDFLKKTFLKALPIVCGLIVYRLSLSALIALHIVNPNNYQLQTTPLYDIVAKLHEVVFHAFDILVSTQDCFPLFLRMTLLALLIFCSLTLLNKVFKSPLDVKHKIITVLLVLGLYFFTVLATKIVFIISTTPFYWGFKMQSGLILLYAFPAAVLLATRIKLYKNVIYIILVAVIASFIRSDIAWQSIQVFSNKHAYSIAYELANRIKALKGFDYRKTYNFVQIGSFDNLNTLIMKKESNVMPKYPAGDQVRGHFQMHNKGVILTYFMPYLKIRGCSTPDTVASLSQDDLRKILEYINKHAPWPADDSVTIINKNIILVYVTSSGARIIPAIERLIEEKSAHANGRDGSR